jgi:hypothetical protein
MTKLTPAQQSLLEAAVAAGATGADITASPKPTLLSLAKRGLILITGNGDRALVTDAGRTALEQAARSLTPPQPPADTVSTAPKGKTRQLVTLMQRSEGATVAEMMEATGWQAHSVRGAISGAIKKGLGLTVTSAKSDGERLYRVVAKAED